MSGRGKLIRGAYSFGARVASALPESVLPTVGKLAGHVGGWPQRTNRKMVARHQRRVTGRTDRRVVDEVMEWYGRYWLEMLRLPADVRRGVIAAHFEQTGYDNITAALEAGKGVIIVLPHLGGWEWAGAWMATLGHHMLAVVEDVEPPELLQWFAEQREAFGIEVVPLGPDVSTRALRALRDNRIVCLAADRDMSGDGVEVEFFGERTTLPGGPATFALRTGAAIIPLGVYFRPGRGHFADIGAPMKIERSGRLRDDIARVTQDMAYAFEDLIRQAPEQWHLTQPNWPSDRQ